MTAATLIAINILAPHVAAAAPPTTAAVDRVEVKVEAKVQASLEWLDFVADYTITVAEDRDEVVFAKPADQATAIPDPLPPSAEPQLFADGFDRGGFEALRVTVNGQPCRPRSIDSPTPVPLIACQGAVAAGQTVTARIEGRLRVPDRFGPFGRRKRQLTLLGGWFPTVGAPNRPMAAASVAARVRIPDGFAAVVGRTYASSLPQAQPSGRWVSGRADGPSLALIVLPALSGTRSAAGGRVRWISARRSTNNSTALRQARLTVETIELAIDTLEQEGLPTPTRDAPLLVVEAPLRRNLARAGPGVVLVSDRAFRILPFERFFRFHRYPIFREIVTAWAYDHVHRDEYRHVAADAVGAFLRDRFVTNSLGYAEDLFDVLYFWSFIPAIDSLLYAPQIAFVGAYFRVVNEADPLRVNLIDPPSPWPRGRIVYEKLLDRVGPATTTAAMLRLARGAKLAPTLAESLGPGAVDGFLDTWLGPYPEMQYSLTKWGSRALAGPGCAPAAACHEATVSVTRTGASIVEPVQLRLTDDDGEARLVWSETSSAALRTITATLSAPLDLVELDPWGRVSETPTLAVPSPKFDNRSAARWRVLLNSFNFQLSPTAGTLDTSLNLGISRRREVRWRFFLSAGFSPEAITLTGSTVRRFGHRVTPDKLAHWVGVSVSGQQLRPDFADTNENYAFTSNLFYGYDNRITAWAPEPGFGFRAALTYNHVFGSLTNVDPDDVGVTRDALALTVRALKSWRVEGRHQFSLRGSVGAYLAGRPQSQLLYFLGGRQAVRGYLIDEDVGRYRALASAEWVHTLLSDANENVVELTWATKLDGALYADIAAIGDELTGDLSRRLRADVGYGLRIYIDYFGVRPGVMSIDLAFPLLDLEGRFEIGPPALYIDFSQSFFTF